MESPGVRWESVLVQKSVCERECVCWPGWARLAQKKKICTLKKAAGSTDLLPGWPCSQGHKAAQASRAKGKKGEREGTPNPHVRASVHLCLLQPVAHSPGRTEALPGCK